MVFYCLVVDKTEPYQCTATQTGEMVKSKFFVPSFIFSSFLVAGEGSLFDLENAGYGTCAIAFKRTGFITIGGQNDRLVVHGKVDR